MSTFAAVMRMGIVEYWERWQRSRGYGVQSPWAYRFVTEVVGERRPYYGYEQIDREAGSGYERRYRRLLLRVRNAVWPSAVVEAAVGSIDAARLAEIAARCGTTGAMVLTGIDSDSHARALWLATRDSDSVGVTFDLGHFAICFFDLARHKQHYRLLF